MNHSKTIFVAVIPVDSKNRRMLNHAYVAYEFMPSILNTFKQLGATIKGTKSAIFNNGISIDMQIEYNATKRPYYTSIEFFISKQYGPCPFLNIIYLNLYDEIALKYKQYCINTMDKVFANNDITKYILSYIDFTQVLSKVSLNRCARISTNLLYNIIIVLSEQDINYKSLNIVICKLINPIDTYLKIQYFEDICLPRIQDIYPQLIMNETFAVPSAEMIKFNNVHTIHRNTIHRNREYISKANQMHKIWIIHSFSLGLIYKLVRENRLIIIYKIDIHQDFIRKKIERYKKQLEFQNRQYLIKNIQNDI